MMMQNDRTNVPNARNAPITDDLILDTFRAHCFFFYSLLIIFPFLISRYWSEVCFRCFCYTICTRHSHCKGFISPQKAEDICRKEKTKQNSTFCLLQIKFASCKYLENGSSNRNFMQKNVMSKRIAIRTVA